MQVQGRLRHNIAAPAPPPPLFFFFFFFFFVFFFFFFFYQIGFMAAWALDNVFPCPGRAYTHERTDLSQVNVMLDVRDATPHLKLAPDGLEIRNDAITLEFVIVFFYYHCYLFFDVIIQLRKCAGHVLRVAIWRVVL